MRIALIAPKWKNGNSYPPLGLAYLAASARKENPTTQVRIFDFNLEMKSTTAQNADSVAEYMPDIVGITCMTNAYKEASALAAEIKKRISAKVVFGGPHPSVFPADTLKNSCVDYVIAGEGEQSFCALIKALRDKEYNLERISGLFYKKNGEIINGEPCALIENLDELSFPARDLLQLHRYPLKHKDGSPIATIMTSRGCPFGCTYCFKGLFGKTYRQRSAENIVTEVIDVLYNHSITHFYFIDDIFMLNVERVKKICSIFAEKGIEIDFQCLARVDKVTKELLATLKRAGCAEIHYGIESGNQEVLDRIKKMITLNGVREAVRLTKEAGIRVKGYFMTGLPGDTLQTVQQTIDFAKELDCDDTMFSLTTPFPGTELFEILKRKHPDTKFDDKFTDAYYYCSDNTQPPSFFNLSEIPTEKLVKLTKKANDIFVLKKRLARYNKRFGSVIGKIFFKISKMEPLLRMGEYLDKKW